MKHVSRVLTIAAAAGCLALFGIGCESGQSTEAEHPTAEHPEGDHPNAEHPEGEHPDG